MKIEFEVIAFDITKLGHAPLEGSKKGLWRMSRRRRGRTHPQEGRPRLCRNQIGQSCGTGNGGDTANDVATPHSITSRLRIGLPSRLSAQIIKSKIRDARNGRQWPIALRKVLAANVGSGSNHCVISRIRFAIQSVLLPDRSLHVVCVTMNNSNHLFRHIRH